ncbi:Jerky protein homolog-like [Oopsacas minuta]|uniref:Jerky protein homolog-like n=1 Tax=Oopsacas minuta TaxID=111878 RepID=A0AAV7JWF8_9METZ|nr:Jerky protein homolog-like [Oopsacas minuta]
MSTIKSSHKSALTIEQRHISLRMLDDGKSERIVAEFFNVGKGSINRIKFNRVAIQLHIDETSEIPENIRKRKHSVVVPMYEDIETAVIEFLKLARDRGMAVTGPMLRTLAEREANANGMEGFKASEGWL